jgi:hypothetical protein
VAINNVMPLPLSSRTTSSTSPINSGSSAEVRTSPLCRRARSGRAIRTPRQWRSGEWFQVLSSLPEYAHDAHVPLAPLGSLGG